MCDAADGLPDRRALALRGREAFSALRRRALRCEDALEVSRLLSDMYALAGGLFAGGRAPLLDACGEVLSRLLGLAWETAARTDGGLRAALCGNLTDALSATPTDASGLRPFLDATLDGWVASQSPGGGWPGLAAGAALERVIVLNRRSFLLLDRRADAPVALAYARCRRAALSRLAESPLPPLPLASRLYTASRLGHAYPLDPAASTACLAVFKQVLERAETGTPEWTLAAGYVAEGWCEEELERAEKEWEEAGMPA